MRSEVTTNYRPDQAADAADTTDIAHSADTSAFPQSHSNLRKRVAIGSAIAGGSVLALSLAGCADLIPHTTAAEGPTATPSNPNTKPNGTPTPTLTEKQIQEHNQTTLQNLTDSLNNPKAFDGNPSNAFRNQNGNLYADGTLVQSTIYNANTKKSSPFFNDYNVRNVGTILYDSGAQKGQPEYWILKVGNNKYTVFKFDDMPKLINIAAELTHPGSGTGGNATGNPFYTPTEVAKMVGNTDDSNVKGLALDLGLDPAMQGVDQLIKAMQGHGTSPNLMTYTQVKDLASGKITLTTTGAAPALFNIPDSDDYLLIH